MLEVMQAPVEVNHIPLLITEPGIELLEAPSGGAAIGRNPVDVCFACQQFPRGQCVAD